MIRPAQRAMIAGVALAFALLSIGCGGSSSDGDAAAHESSPVVIFAAASTTDAVERLADRYHQTTGRTVLTSFASSSTLARHIEEGATAHLFLSANIEWMDYLAERHLLAANSRSDLLSNRLVLVVRKGAEARSLTKGNLPESLAVGEPSHVPAGRYAMEAIRALDLEEGLEDRLIPALDVRAALRLVEMGEADAGIVYASDAQSSGRVEIVEEIDESLHTPVRYQVALIGRPTPAARELLAFLRSDDAAAIFRELGLTVIRE